MPHLKSRHFKVADCCDCDVGSEASSPVPRGGANLRVSKCWSEANLHPFACDHDDVVSFSYLKLVNYFKVVIRQSSNRCLYWIHQRYQCGLCWNHWARISSSSTIKFMCYTYFESSVICLFWQVKSESTLLWHRIYVSLKTGVWSCTKYFNEGLLVIFLYLIKIEAVHLLLRNNTF